MSSCGVSLSLVRCQIVRFYYLGAKLSGAKLSRCQIVWCQIVWCQIVRCKIVLCQIILPPSSAVFRLSRFCKIRESSLQNSNHPGGVWATSDVLSGNPQTLWHLYTDSWRGSGGSVFSSLTYLTLNSRRISWGRKSRAEGSLRPSLPRSLLHLLIVIVGQRSST